MAENNYILVSLDDEKSKAISEVLSSKTSKKIINYLAETKEASQKDLSDALEIPLNTVEYNIKKLLDSGFVKKRKNFFWSKKGKKIIMYELSNKSIVISHKKKISEKIKSIIPGFILAAVGTFAVWVYEKVKYASNSVADSGREVLYAATESASDSIGKAGGVVPQEALITPIGTPLWLWFLIGSLIAIFIIAVVNWKKL